MRSFGFFFFLFSWMSYAQTDQQIFLIQYQLAKQNSEPQACEIMSDLAKQQTFSFRELALLHAYSLCKDISSLAKISDTFLTEKPWAESLFNEAQIQTAIKNKQKKKLPRLLFEKSKLITNLKEKIEILQSVLALSKKYKQQNLYDETEERLQQLAPRFIEAPEKDEWYKVGVDFLLQRNFTKARFYFNKIIFHRRTSTEEKYLAWKQFRLSYKIQQDKKKYIFTTKKFLKWCEKFCSTQQLNDTYINLARAQWTEGEIPSAQKTLAQAKLILTQKKYSLIEIYWLLARIAEEAKDYSAAFQNFDRALESESEKVQFKERVLYNKTWLQYKTNQYEEAARNFAELDRTSTDKNAKNRYNFWQAIAWSKADQKEASQALLKKLIKDDPLGYYGLLAHYKLGLPLKIIKKIKPSEQEPTLLSSVQKFTIQSLAQMDEKDLLTAYLEKELSLSEIANKDANTYLFILKNLAQAGAYQPFFLQLNTLSEDLKQQLLDNYPELIFPKKYEQQIKKYAENLNVEPEFVLSIMRQESSFDPTARSPADAFGLLQLLPDVAKRYTKIMQIKFANHEDLYKPEVNIPLGIALLADLLKKYKGQMLLTSAAYNANEKAIQNWLKNRYQNDTLEFIEEIPYDETRNYVKLVMRNYIFYHRMTSPTESVEFPAGYLRF